MLAALRQSLDGARAAGDAGGESPRNQRLSEARARIAAHGRAMQPERATRRGDARIAQFVEMVRFSQAGIDVLDQLADVPSAIARLQAARGIHGDVVLPGDNALRQLDWHAQGLVTATRLVRSGDTLAVALADGGIAETGTLALRSGPASPSTSNFLPEHHVIVVAASRVHASYEDYWDALRRESPARGDAVAMPRTINWITGPSRSGDIELRMLMGAHGPLSVHVLLVR